MSDELRIDCKESRDVRRSTNSSSIPFSPSTCPISVRQQLAIVKLNSPKQETCNSGASTPTRRQLPMVCRKNLKGEISLHVAARKGNVAECKRLLEEGAFINAQDNAGWTPIHEACEKNHYGVVELLIRHGAELSLRSIESGVTPLHDACAIRNHDMIKILLENGADPNIRNLLGALPSDCLKDDADLLKLFDVEYPRPTTSQTTTTHPTALPASLASTSSMPPKFFSSPRLTNSEEDDQEEEENDDEEETSQPACRSSALISTELPKNEGEDEPTPSVSPDDPTFTLTTPRRAASTRIKRVVTKQAKKEPSSRPQRKSRGTKNISPGGEQARRGKPRSVKRGGGVASISYYEPDIEEKQTDESALQRTTASVYLGAGDTAPSSSYSSVSAPRSFVRDLDKRFSAMSSQGETSKETKEDVYEFRDDEEDNVPLSRFDSTSTSIRQLKRKYEEDETRKVPPLRITLKPPEEAAQSEPKIDDVPNKEKEKKNKEKTADTEIEIIDEVGGQKTKTVDRKKYTTEDVEVLLPPEGYVLRKCLLSTKQKKPGLRSKRFLRKEGIYEKPVRTSTGRKEITVTVVTNKVVSEPSSSSNPGGTVRPIRRNPKFGNVCMHMLNGDPNRACHTVENQFRKNYSHEEELRNDYPPRPILMKEAEYLVHRVDRDWGYFPRIIRNAPKPKDVPADCPPEMVELWKEFENERNKLTNRWNVEKLRLKCSLQRRMIQDNEYRYRQKHGDFTKRPGFLTLITRAYEPTSVIEPQKAPNAPTVEESLKQAADLVEKTRFSQFMVARIIYKKQVAFWKQDIKKFRLPKSMYRKRLDYFIPNLMEMVTPCEPDL